MNKTLYIILGAGVPRNKNVSISLQKNYMNLTTLEHQLAFANTVSSDLLFVCGYDEHAIISKFPFLNTVRNHDWKESGSAFSLYCALDSLVNNDAYESFVVSYGDVLIKKEVFSELLELRSHELRLLINTSNPSRNATTRKLEVVEWNGHEHEFAGVFSFRSSSKRIVAEWLSQNLSTLKKSSIADMLHKIRENLHDQLEVEVVKGDRSWAHLEHSESIARFAIGTKAETLSLLHNKMTKSRVLPLVTIEYGEWISDEQNIVNYIFDAIKKSLLIVRSSSKLEDSFTNSNAGKFLSISNIPRDSQALILAINQVFYSYGKEYLTSESQVLVQPFMLDLEFSGVAMTRTTPSFGPYHQIEINQDSTTDIITGGKPGNREIWKILKDEKNLLGEFPKHITSLNDALLEIQDLLKHDALDIEFAIDRHGQVIIFQVRPLIANDDAQDTANDKDVFESILLVDSIIKHSSSRIDLIELQDRIFLSNMADWNPAEIIGRQPRVLAYDLYDYLVTGETWAKQRQNIGYSKLADTRLVSLFSGKSYVHLPKSILSFVPNNLPVKLKIDIVEGSLLFLEKNPHLHDKLEFDIIPTCINFDTNNWYARFPYMSDFSTKEFDLLKGSLLKITENIFSQVLKDSVRLDPFMEKTPPTDSQVNFNWKQALQVCKEFEVLEFSNFARASFVATSLLNTALNLGAISSDRLDAFWRSLNSLTSLMMRDAFLVKVGSLDFETFCRRYGHLRPGTYDINSPRYIDNPDTFLIPLIDSSRREEKNQFKPNSREVNSFSTILLDTGLNIDPSAFFDFCRKAIVGREILKLRFTRNLSQSLEEFARIGRSLEITRSELGNLPLDFFFTLGKQRQPLDRNAEKALLLSSLNRKDYEITRKIELPDFISPKTNLFAFKSIDIRANFPTNESITAQVIRINSTSAIDISQVNGRIVAVENADPGFEFLFALPIAGLITSYGGPNSHLAIRCAELNLPSAIGIGRDAFEQILDGNLVNIDSIRQTCRTWKLS